MGLDEDIQNVIRAISPFLRGQGQEVMANDSFAPVDRLNRDRS